ncbi:MAG TPA: hypothetical protein VJP86_03595 [Vicinamibacterales bacterium]|nr:hypothetical protein [Vicinamibacterales bacterium]
MTEQAVSVSTPRASGRSIGAGLIGAVLLIVGLAAALSVNVVETGYGVKGDEATYVGMALSLAYDGDLAYKRQDLERFWGIYKGGPEGIFLKRGKQIHLWIDGSAPFVHFDNRQPDARLDRAYFSKAMIYSVAAAPFVRLFGMNGFLVFHVLLLFTALACGYTFLAARGSAAFALTYSLAFAGASALPVYMVFLTPEIFNFTLVFVAYFLWAFKETGAPRSRFLAGGVSDHAAAVCLGIATYSKPFVIAPLVLPLVLLPWWRRRFVHGFLVGATSVAAAAVVFAANAAVTGEFNYQGGDRYQFYSAPYSPTNPPDRGFLFDTPDGLWGVRGKKVGTDDLGAQDSLKPSEVFRLLRINALYFPLGRHFGFVPYFFPGFVALIAWLATGSRRDVWRGLIFLAIVVSTVVLLVIFPYTWSGGGGPPGNRYYMNVYPAFFFLMPSFASVAPAVLAWIGGALFTAKILVNPFVSAKEPWQITERGFARRLPVELTMARDLPVMLDPRTRGRVVYGADPFVLLYYMDEHATPPEPDGMWIFGDGRADIIVRAEHPLDHLAVTAVSPIRTTLTMSAGGAVKTIALTPGNPASFDVATVGGVKDFTGYSYLLSAQSSDGFTPRLVDPTSNDNRNLGAQVQFRPVNASR